MSIINDALKKVQTNLDQTTDAQKAPVASLPEQKKKIEQKSSRLTEAVKSEVKKHPSKPASIEKKEETRITLNKRFVSLIYLGFIVTGILIAFFMYSWNRTSHTLQRALESINNSQPQPVKTSPSPKPSFFSKVTASKRSSNLIVSGTMRMGDKIVALVNEDIYEIGDTLDGKKIVSISAKNIELLDSEGNLSTLNVRGRR